MTKFNLTILKIIVKFNFFDYNRNWIGVLYASIRIQNEKR